MEASRGNIFNVIEIIRRRGLSHRLEKALMECRPWAGVTFISNLQPEDDTVKLLLCVDASGSSDRAISRVTELGLGHSKSNSVTLFTVCESLPEHVFEISEKVGMHAKELASAWSLKSRSAGEQALAQAKAKLLESGLPESAIHIKLCVADATPESRQVAAAASLIEEMTSGNYNLVVIGRRGAKHLSENLIGSVADKVIRAASGRSVLLVD